MEEKKVCLVEKPSTYKLLIPVDVEDKIRYMCQAVHDVEWSGVLFFDYKGTFEDKNNPLTIICKDILVMDIGNATYTEFINSPDVASHMVDNDLLDYQMGLIHSHNNMAKIIKLFIKY
jgi:hypothetical protein